MQRKGDLPFHRASLFTIWFGALFLKIWYNINISMDFIPFCPDVMEWRPLRIFESQFQRKTRKKPKNKIRPAKAIFDGVVKPLVRGAVKNLNPRKGTETIQILVIG